MLSILFGSISLLCYNDCKKYTDESFSVLYVYKEEELFIMDGMNNILSLIVLGAGAYVLYSYFAMKQTGKINGHLLLSKGLIEQQCTDKKAFVEECLPAVLVLGIAGVAYGIFDVFLNYMMTESGITLLFNMFGLLIFLAVIIWYMVRTAKVRKKYFVEVDPPKRKK